MPQEKKLFGTDGIRGIANQYPMVPDMLVKIAMGAAQSFCSSREGPGRRKVVVIGKDTRQSCYMIETALTAGFTAMGVDVLLVGPMPTPAVAVLTRSLRAHFGVMISASHNPYHDNGIKFFNNEGVKLTDDQERALENLILEGNIFDSSLAIPGNMGKVSRIDALGRYVEYVKGTLSRGTVLRGLKVVIDCANGAAYKVAPQVLWELGANVITIGTNPDGVNINEGCGATNLKALKKAVLEHEAHLGIALDGDGDRLMMVDEKGNGVDGDSLMALIAVAWSQEGRLKNNVVVGTLMSNLGLEKYLDSLGIRLVRANVGDRYVIENMQREGGNFGGEQSGHLIFSDYVSTGDGLLAALQILELYVRQDKPFSLFAHPFTPVPQVLKNVRVTNKKILADLRVKEKIQQTQQKIHEIGGRLVVRPSGTEPLVRLMGEANDAQALEKLILSLAEAIQGI